MPIYPTPGIAETTAAGRPAAVSDCAGDMWHRFRAPEFRSRKICEDWVRKHPAGRKIARSRTPARRPTAPR